jgi:polyhydroxyalkanoate synthesis regulator phasin
MTKKKKTVEFEEGWADELVKDGLMTEDEVDRLMRGIIQIIENGEIYDGDEGDGGTVH